MGGGKGPLIQEDQSATLSTLQDQTLFHPMGFSYKAGGKAGSVGAERGKAPTLYASRHDAAVLIENHQEMVPDDQGGQQISVRTDGVSPTIRAETHGNLPCVLKSFGEYEVGGVASTVKSRDYKDATDLVVAGLDCRNGTEYPEMNGAIQTKANGGFSVNYNLVVRVKYIVRRLTPLEGERLQDFPDGWTDIGEWVDSKGKLHKPADSPRYKALGNSIALPNWKWILKRISGVYERTPTMASLFDGIGGFPLIWEQINGKGSCLWASEIEEFPMAVTKMRFGDGQ